MSIWLTVDAEEARAERHKPHTRATWDKFSGTALAQKCDGSRRGGPANLAWLEQGAPFHFT
jgi:hypothetical protein